MSGIPFARNGNLPPVVAARSEPRSKAVSDKLTVQGIALFVIGLAIATSAFERFRLDLGGLHVHLYLWLMAPFFLYMMATSYGDFPPVLLAALLVFTGMYAVSTLSGGSINFNEAIKLFASIATLMTGVLMVRSEADFRAGVLGLSIAIGFLAFFNLEATANASHSVMETGNKNAYSLYALPVMLLSGFLLVKKNNRSSLWVKLILLVFTFAPLIVIFMGANRSGWLGCLLIALMLMIVRGFDLRGVFLVGILGYAAFFVITNFGTTKIFTYRLQQTFVEGTHGSDEKRRDLLFAAVQTGLENPIAGVSPQRLPYELSQRLGLGYLIASHNVVGELVGGSGLICSGALLLFAVLLWRLKPQHPGMPLSPNFRESRKLVRMILVLWLFRGFFTGEILFSPSFSLSVGMVIGLCLAIERHELAQCKAALTRPNPAFVPLPRPLPPGLVT
jgi:hypothetical protein